MAGSEHASIEIVQSMFYDNLSINLFFGGGLET